jgi:hypothetical protein
MVLLYIAACDDNVETILVVLWLTLAHFSLFNELFASTMAI